VSALELALVAAALLAGVAGSWSPCGFSMVDTIASGARRGRARVGVCAAFAAGALAGGVATFTCLAGLGTLLPGGGGAQFAVAAGGLAALAAWAEARGLRIVPQIRRQVPEPWRRTLPLALAGSLYGVLLGLGFATFVLTYGVWALAAASVAFAEVQLGLLIGAGFGIGRALPVVVLGNLADRPLGLRAVATMAERPQVLRGLRFAIAVALGVCATTALASPDRAAASRGPGAHDPSFADGALAYDTLAGGRLRLAGATRAVPGRDPAVGGGLLAYRRGDRVLVQHLASGVAVGEFDAGAADAIALSAQWVVVRQRGAAGGDELIARPLANLGLRSLAAEVRPPGQLGRPVLNGDLLVYHATTRRGSHLAELNLATGQARVLRRSTTTLLLNPSVLGSDLLYVEASRFAQRLKLGPAAPGGRDRVILRIGPLARRDPGYARGYSRRTRTPRPRRPANYMMWTTALARTGMYVSFLPRSGNMRRAKIVKRPR
jgi:hypothetical protein